MCFWKRKAQNISVFSLLSQLFSKIDKKYFSMIGKTVSQTFAWLFSSKLLLFSSKPENGLFQVYNAFFSILKPLVWCIKVWNQIQEVPAFRDFWFQRVIMKCRVHEFLGLLLKYGFCKKSLRKNETLTSWTLLTHFFPDQCWSVLIWKKSEPKVFNWSEFHFLTLVK